MACGIVSGYSLDCKDTVGGIKKIYVTEFGNLTTVAENVSGYVTSITKAVGTKYFTYQLEARAANKFDQNIQSAANVGTVAYEQSIVANFTKLKYETQIKLQNLIKNRLSIIVETKDGSFFLFGKDEGLEVTAGSANSGQAMNEFQGYQLTFTAMTKNLANEVDPTIIAALLV